MPRPARYTVDVLLDAAADLLASDGPGAVTMSAVARSTGAPSGSVYHRFPTRAALCGELWVRTEERLLDALAEVLDGEDDPARRGVAGALCVLGWCRAHPVEAHVLLTGPGQLGLDDWPDHLVGRRKRLQRRLKKALGEIPGDTARVSAAVMDVPYAIVRRHLGARQTVPGTADALVEDCARVLTVPS
ncbi:TetR/AcrR family transcriptional regulator [Mycolicibacterium sp. 3033]|nr:TetR/AcrR family transcriptional regulator [Mycolicibacterium aurantiacum]